MERPEFLAARPDASTPARWKKNASAPVVQAVRGEHTAALIETGDHPALRRVALIMARYGVTTEQASELPAPAVLAANLAHALAIYGAHYTTKVPSITPKMLAQITGPTLSDSIVALASLPKPSQYRGFIAERTQIQPKERRALLEAARALRRHHNTRPEYLTDLDIYAPADDENPAQTYGALRAHRLAQELADIEQGHQDRATAPHARAMPEITPDENGALWFPLIVATPKLTRAHTGLMGRRRRPAPTGKALRYPERLTTDPMRQVFAAKSRGLGAVVLVDISGSMSLTDDDLDAMIDAAHGSTVIAYSASREQHRQGRPNAWLLAHKNRRASQVPYGNIGNGCDLPALEYAQTFRRHDAPLIWISDGGVTGADDLHTYTHLRSVAKYCRAHRVTQVPNARAALATLRAAHHRRPRPAMSSNLAETLRR